MIKTRSLQNYTWVQLVKPNPDEAGEVVRKYHLPTKFKNYILDRHEQPRATFDLPSGFYVLVIRAVTANKTHQSRTTPLFICFAGDILITVAHTAGMMGIFNRISVAPTGKVYQELFLLLGRVQRPYFNELDDVMARTEALSNRDLHAITRARLDELTLLKSRLVYLRSSTAGNLIALQELREIVRQRLPHDQPSWQPIMSSINDLLVEYRQCQMSFDVVGSEVSETESYYGNILDFRLNDTMMFLTIWSLILAIPPIISGFYGMNTYLPLANRHYAWAYSLLMTLALAVAIVILYRIHQRHQR